jgi:hypothetical protein
MKKLKLIASILALTFAIGCSKDDTTDTPDVVAAPSNLVVTITPESKLVLKVKATATNATSFDVYFGVAGEIPKNIAVGGEATYTYAAEGNYNVKVVAKNAGTETVEKVTAVAIAKLIAAPVPTVAAADVKNLFSDTYSNPTVNFRTDWSADSNPLKSVYKAITIAGNNNAKEYSELSYVGIEPTTQIDATTMTHFHLDVWSADFTKFKVKLVDWGANGVYDGPGQGDDKEHELIYDAPKKEEWVSLDIPLFKFTGLTTKAHIAQIVLSAEPTGSAKVIIDNMYFYKGVVVPVAMPLDFESTTIDYSWVGFEGANASLINNPDKTGINTSNKVLSIEKIATAQPWAGASMAFTAPIDLTKGTKIKIAVWSPKVGAKILLKSEDTTSPKDGNGNPTIFVEKESLTTVANAWEVLTFDISTAAGYSASKSYRNIVLFPDFSVAGSGATATYYFDNITQSN